METKQNEIIKKEYVNVYVAVDGTEFNDPNECAEWIVGCGRYDHDYDQYCGALRYYFNTKTGYDHIANYERTFPLIKKYIIMIEA